jgi:DNA-binding NtrC family response regulator
MATPSTILIADDEPDLLEALAFDFQRRGYGVLTASNAKEAEALCDREAVHLVLSDLNMPGGSGLELAQRLRAKGMKMPFVLFVSDGSLSAADAMARGVTSVFSKPFSRPALFEAVAALLS